MKTVLIACAVCFGDPASPLTKAVMPAVVFLMGTVGVVLGGIATLAIVWTLKAHKTSPHLDPGVKLD